MKLIQAPISFVKRPTIVRLAKDTSGAVSCEYSYLTALIAVVAVAGMILIGLTLQERFAVVGDTLAGASSGLPILW